MRGSGFRRRQPIPTPVARPEPVTAFRISVCVSGGKKLVSRGRTPRDGPGLRFPLRRNPGWRPGGWAASRAPTLLGVGPPRRGRAGNRSAQGTGLRSRCGRCRDDACERRGGASTDLRTAVPLFWGYFLCRAPCDNTPGTVHQDKSTRGLTLLFQGESTVRLNTTRVFMATVNGVMGTPGQVVLIRTALAGQGSWDVRIELHPVGKEHTLCLEKENRLSPLSICQSGSPSSATAGRASPPPS